ncbi:MAG: hypothetical protein MJB57_14650, partial [Gemmatimonadetes bacterium]|nr:hypothetical protein [Gemmatimonadota bacterium]
RIAARAPGPSDADSTTQEEVARRWEAPSARTARNTRSVDTGQTPAWSVEQALAHLDDLGV